jgi:OOP family OmpA-OmpF porin
VVRTTVTGDCVHTGFWTPDTATPECNPDLFAKFRGAAPTAAAVQPTPQAAPAEYEAMEYAEAPEYEPAPYEEAAPAAAEAPLEDFYAPGDAPDLVPVPPPSAFAEEGPDDRIGEPRMYYEEAEGAAAEEGIVARSQFYEEESVEPEEGIVGRSQYYEEEEGVQRDDGIIARNEYYEEEEGAAQDDGIIARNEYYEEEEGAAQDDGIIGQSQYYEEEEVQKEEDVIARSEYYEEEEVQKEEDIIARSEYYEEEGKEPEDLISEPTATEESMVAAAEQEQEVAPAVAAAEQEQEVAPAVAAAEQEQEAAPAVAAAEEEKEPTPVMLPVTITLEAEPWFDFDRYAVRSDARDKLDALAGDLTGVEYDEILVVGHADRIGTPEYNQRLSERRARSVKSYLVGKGVPADRIKTEGRGEFEPATDPAFCQGLRKQKLIDCLQPDRRVEVTVTGTKLQQ